MYSNNKLVGQRKANGAITAFSIVCEDTANDGSAIIATANRGRILGVGPNYAVADTVMFQYTFAGVAQLAIGSGGCTAGDYLKSDANGHGVIIATGGTTPQHVVGVAMRSAAENDIIPIQVNPEVMTAGQDYIS